MYPVPISAIKKFESNDQYLLSNLDLAIKFIKKRSYITRQHVRIDIETGQLRVQFTEGSIAGQTVSKVTNNALLVCK